MTKRTKTSTKPNLFGIKIPCRAYLREENCAYIGFRVPTDRGLSDEFFVRRRDVADARRLRDILLDQEVDLPTNPVERAELLAAIAAFKPPVRRELTTRLGWHGNTLVLPFESIGPDDILFYGDPGCRREEAALGTLKRWKARLAGPAGTSSLAVFAICVGFAAPLMRFAPSVEAGIFHIHGPSGTGKTTVIAAGASVWRGGRAALDTWNTTQNALNELFAKRSDGLICLDEITLLAGNKQALRSLVQQAAHLTTQGKGRQRSVLVVGGIDPGPYRFLGLSTGEKSAAAIATEAGERRMKGEEARLIDVPVPSDDFGVFDQLDVLDPEGAAPTPGDVARTLNEAAGLCFGTSGPALARYLVKDMTRAQAKVDQYMGEFVRKVTERMRVGSDGWEQRILMKFALVYAAGRIALDAKLVPWAPALIGTSVLHVYRMARGQVRTPHDRMSEALDGLQAWARGDGLVDLVAPKTRPTKRQVRDANALRYRKGDQVLFLVPVEKFKALDDLGSCDLLLDRLETDGILVRAGGSTRKRVRQVVPLKGMKRGTYYYALTEDLISYELPYLRGRDGG